MPRVAAAALAYENIDDINAHRRPKAPGTLDDEGIAEWNRVVSKMPPEWFPPETLSILEDRCQHVTWMKQTAAQINTLRKKKQFDYDNYRRLMILAMAQSRTLVLLDTKMRLTQQSSYDKSKRKHSKGPKKPWTAEEEPRSNRD
jgi:hypothetical protein